MQDRYKMNQLTLEMSTSFVPERNHPAHEINNLVDAIEPQFHCTTGRPREYNPLAMMKLVLFAYLRGAFSCRQIELLARENVIAMWLTDEQTPSYRTIARFLVSDEAESLL